MPAQVAGSPFTFVAAASRGSPAASLAVTAGALPAGLTLDPATGVISVTAAALATTGLDATPLLILATVLTLAGGALLYRRRAVARHPG
ncbi:MAG TPA: putative Ig domain-containing protein [Protaetiibacter sp.]|nr:putative Ig domain-containing protein [Protaetiibacter sp.]